MIKSATICLPGFPYLHVRTWTPQKKKPSYGVLKAVWVRVEKKHYYRLIFLNMSSWMCVFYSVCDRSGLLSLSVFRPTRAAQRSAAHARICVKTAWEWESNAAYIGISPHKQERERQRERETAPMSLQRTFSPAREAERCLETAASTGSSRAHQLRKRGT